jgi:hypothetical protein
MTLFYNLATLLETHLKEYDLAVYYYTQYQSALMSYQDSLLEETNPDSEKIKEIELKLAALDQHIRQLRTEHKIDYTNKIWTN